MAAGQLTRIKAAEGLLGNSNVSLYAVPANQKITYLELTLCNTDLTTVYAPFIYFVPSGSNASAQNLRINGVSGVSALKAGETCVYSWNPFLTAGDSIQGYAGTANKISYFISVVLEEV